MHKLLPVQKPDLVAGACPDLPDLLPYIAQLILWSGVVLGILKEAALDADRNYSQRQMGRTTAAGKWQSFKMDG